jgi:hypothetical protein
MNTEWDGEKSFSQETWLFMGIWFSYLSVADTSCPFSQFCQMFLLHLFNIVYFCGPIIVIRIVWTILRVTQRFFLLWRCYLMYGAFCLWLSRLQVNVHISFYLGSDMNLSGSACQDYVQSFFYWVLHCLFSRLVKMWHFTRGMICGLILTFFFTVHLCN